MSTPKEERTHKARATSQRGGVKRTTTHPKRRRRQERAQERIVAGSARLKAEVDARESRWAQSVEWRRNNQAEELLTEIFTDPTSKE
jgi:hypothetical protein